MTDATTDLHPDSAQGEELDPRRWRALIVCLAAGFMTLLDVSIVNVALPSIRSGLGASSSDLQWILSGYSLTFGLVLVPAGRIGDAKGRRVVFVVALGLFTLTSAVAGFAGTATLLVVARLAQGAAAGILNPQTSGVIQDLFRGPERGRAFGLLGATIGLSTAVGPLMGGLLIRLAGSADGWRWVFFVNVPVGLVAMVLAWRLLPADRRKRAPGRRESLDPVGALLLGAAVFVVLLPLVEERQWDTEAKWLLVPGGAALGWLFLRWERRHTARGRAPLIDLELYGLRSFTVGSLLAAVYFSGFTAIFFVLTLFLQVGRGYSALAAGLAITPFALGSAAASSVGGREVARRGRSLVVLGLVMVLVGLIATDITVGLVSGSAVGWAIAFPLVVAGVGSGLVIAPNRTLTLDDVPVRQGGVAAGVLQVGQRIGAAVGVAVVGAVFFITLSADDDWTAALTRGLWVCVALITAALTLAASDLRQQRRGRRE